MYRTPSQIKNIFLVVFFLFLSQISIGQISPNTRETLLKARGNLTNLTKTISSNTDSGKIITNDILSLNRTIFSLYTKINQCDDTIIDDVFVQSLIESQKVIESFKQNSDSAELISLINAIQKDYELKINSSDFGAEPNIISVIEITVLTQKDNVLVEGYDVRCNYLWDINLSKARFNFTNPTNSAKMKLSPGYYVFWLEKDGNLIKKKNVEIGNLHEDKEKVIFNL